MKFKRTWKNLVPYQSQLKGTIEQRNKQFNSMDAISQRKELALDILTLLYTEGVVANANRQYWTDDFKYSVEDIENAKEFQQAIIKGTAKGEYCSVCARGACMLATIRLGNELSPKDTDIDNIAEGGDYMLKGFTMDELRWMENFYEGKDINSTWSFNNMPNIKEWGNIDFEKDYPYEYHTNKRLTNLYLNVLYNGVFDYKDKTDYLKSILSK